MGLFWTQAFKCHFCHCILSEPCLCLFSFPLPKRSCSWPGQMNICSSFKCRAVYEAFWSPSSSNNSGCNYFSVITMCIFGWEKQNKAGSRNILSLLPKPAVYSCFRKVLRENNALVNIYINTYIKCLPPRALVKFLSCCCLPMGQLGECLQRWDQRMEWQDGV